MATHSMHSVVVMGHRGARGHAPENTLASFERGIELGATMLELDVHLTKDERLIVIHDGYLDRTTDGSGPVHLMTFEEIRKVDAGSWFAPEFAGQRVPALEEVMELADGRALLNIEVKVGGQRPNLVYYDALPERLAGLLTQSGWVDRVVVSSFEMRYLIELKRLVPSLRLALLHSQLDEDLLEKVTAAGFEGIHTAYSLVDEKLVTAAHERGLMVRAWTVNDTQSMRQMLELGVDGICTDYPDRLVEVLSTFPGEGTW